MCWWRHLPPARFVVVWNLKLPTTTKSRCGIVSKTILKPTFKHKLDWCGYMNRFVEQDPFAHYVVMRFLLISTYSIICQGTWVKTSKAHESKQPRKILCRQGRVSLRTEGPCTMQARLEYHMLISKQLALYQWILDKTSSRLWLLCWEHMDRLESKCTRKPSEMVRENYEKWCTSLVTNVSLREHAISLAGIFVNGFYHQCYYRLYQHFSTRMLDPRIIKYSSNKATRLV